MDYVVLVSLYETAGSCSGLASRIRRTVKAHPGAPIPLHSPRPEGTISARLLRSSSGLGHRPLTAKIAGSNPVRSTKHLTLMAQLDAKLVREWKARYDAFNQWELEERRRSTYQERFQ